MASAPGGGAAPLMAFTPLPPARNGIADYAAHLLAALHGVHYEVATACESWESAIPPRPGIAVLDAALAHRWLDEGGETRVLHQLGNNAQHGFVLRALRRHPGVVTLHDAALLHLHETMGEPAEAIRAGMAIAAPGPLAETFARQRRDAPSLGLPPGGRADHVLFDLAGEVLAQATAVIVHSHYARRRLRALHGAARTAHVAVVPHLLPPAAMPDRAAARARLGLAEGECLLLTAGFATRAKRFDWLAGALDLAGAAGARPRWIHAGEERPEELALGALMAARPGLAGARITGFLPEAALDDHLAAADVLVNLRFPATGESSGSLARAFAAGTCCIVSDTAGYAELPREAVLHIPPAGAVPALATGLAALARDPGLARRIGAAGRDYARREMALPAIAARYAAVIEESRARLGPVAASRPATPPLRAVALHPRLRPAALRQALYGLSGSCRLFLGAADVEALAALTLDRPGLLAGLLPPEAALRAVRVMLPPAAPGLLLDLDLPGWRG